MKQVLWCDFCNSQGNSVVAERDRLTQEVERLKGELQKLKEAMTEQNHTGGCTLQISFWKNHADTWEATGMNALANVATWKSRAERLAEALNLAIFYVPSFQDERGKTPKGDCRTICMEALAEFEREGK